MTVDYNAGVDEKSRDALTVELLSESLPDLVAVYRFGSSVLDAVPGPDSDLDYALLARRPLDALARFDLQERLAAALGRTVDRVDLRTASSVMAVQVLASGVVLHESVAAERGVFEDLAYSSYARLNEERRASSSVSPAKGPSMADDVLLNKAAIIARCVRRVREEHAGDDANLISNQTKQDAIILNLLRACETAIDAAMHIVRVERLGVPQETREAFVLLERRAGLTRLWPIG